MRVTETMSRQALLTNIHQTSTERLEILNQLASGKRIQAPSDDPLNIKNVIQLEKEIKDVERYQLNINNAKDWLSATELALNDISENISQVQSIAMQAANDTIGAEDRKLLADQLDIILDSIVSTSNQTFNDQYLFGGTAVDSAPFQLSSTPNSALFDIGDDPLQLPDVNLADDELVILSEDGLTTFTEGTDYEIDRKLGTVSGLTPAKYQVLYYTKNYDVNYKGMDGRVEREIMENDTMQINISGEDAFIKENNMFQTLLDLESALIKNDTDRIRSLNTNLENISDQIIRYTSITGIKYDHLTDVEASLSDLAIRLEEQRSIAEDADFAELAVDYEALEINYNAILSAGSSIIQTSLIDYLG